MIITVKNQYRIRFRHEDHAGKRVTTCTVECQGDAAHAPHTYLGQAHCSPSDTFSRSVGRKIALARALRLAFDREGRKAAWAAVRKEREKVTNKPWPV